MAGTRSIENVDLKNITYGKVGALGKPPALGPSVASRKGNSGRDSVPYGWQQYSHTWQGIISRRGFEAGNLFQSKVLLNKYLKDSPLRLLTLLPDIHPSVSLAAWNALRLACKDGDIKLCVYEYVKGQAAGKMVEEGDAYLKAFWDAQPDELGGFQGLLTSLMLSALFTGLVAVEGVPGPPMQGMYRVYPIDTLTLRFGRLKLDEDLHLYQRQTSVDTGYQELNRERVYWRAMDNFPEDPYGRAPYATALVEVLADLAMMQDLRDAVHSAAWPRIQIGFNFTEMFRIASEVVQISDPEEAAQWVKARFDELQAYVQTIKSDDAILHDTNGTSNILQGGGFQGLEPVLIYLRQRIAQSLKTLPTLLGINDGSTQTYTSVEWGIYASSLEDLRKIILSPIIKLLNKHFQLMGLPYYVEVDAKPIRTTDDKAEADTEAVRIANAANKRDQGFIDQDTASQEITNKNAVGPAPPPFVVQGEPGTSPQGQGPPPNPEEPPKNQPKPARQKKPA